MSGITSDALIKLLELEPHVEGGFYRRTYRAKGLISKEGLPDAFSGDRNYSTAIYFLLPKETKSVLHRLKVDEIWHFYLGGPMTLFQIHPNGETEKTILGQDVKSGQKLQHIVPAGDWFGGCPNPESPYSLVGCTVAPGFDFDDFEIGKRSELLKTFPNAKEIIEKLTPRD